MQNRNNQNIKVIDVSHHNGTIDWAKVASDGVKGAYIKLTEGTTFLDKKSYDNYIGAKNAGLRVGFYHFAHADNDPIAEVNFFLNKLGSMKVDLPHCLDLEENKGKTKAQVTAFAVRWMEYIEKKTSITPILYTGYSFIKSNFTSAVAKYPLWVARYSGSNGSKGFANPGNTAIWNRWAMFQYTDQGKVKGINGNVDINEMDLDFFNSINTGVTVVENNKPSAQLQQGDSGLAVKELQGLTSTGKADEKTLAKMMELLKGISNPIEESLPKVTSLGDKYSFQVKAKKDIEVYKYANVTENFRTIKKDTIFSVYGYTYAAWAVPGGFVQIKDVEPISVTIKTGGLSKDMEAEFRAFLKNEGNDSELHVNAIGNPSAEITAAGLDFVKVKQFLDKKG
ncbi:glycoside hydrolase family 25 protein [Priestia megaterium]|uniref:glycoside hydrolase family 25 protein n=1 Tax=Priestia megaterium TaxID=1404 RepID=UPI003399825A